MKLFEKVKIKQPERSGFDLSHELKTSITTGKLVPVLCQEVLPSDHFKLDVEAFVRMQPLLAPLMHRVNVYMHCFFVPNRIIWEDWEDFITGGQSGNQVVNMPTFAIADCQTYNEQIVTGGLADYLGMPTELNQQANKSMPSISQLPFRAYQQIYNDFYMDANLQTKLDYDKGSSDIEIDAPEAQALLTLKYRNWEKDYFTSALPNAQRGNPVQIPVNQLAVTGQNFLLQMNMDPPTPGPLSVDVSGTILDSNSDELMSQGQVAGNNVNTGTINDLKRAYAIQNWLQASMQGGYRYVESLLHWFGVRSSDQRLQRAEYLGGGKLPITIGEVLQTSETATTPQGTQTGRGVGAAEVNGFSKTFEEHGYVMCIMSIMPRTAYMQGIPKHFLKENRFDYFFKQFANLGEQPIINSELYLSDEAIDDNEGTFGYAARYSEYRFQNDRVSGEMRHDYDYWHWARKFANKPSLNSTFVQCLIDNRVFPVEQQENPFLVQLYFNFYASRPLPQYSQPI